MFMFKTDEFSAKCFTIALSKTTNKNISPFAIDDNGYALKMVVVLKWDKNIISIYQKYHKMI